MIAPEVANKAQPVAGIVLLAPIGRKLSAVIVQQVRYLGQGSPKELADLERQADEISAHKMPPAQYFFGAPASYYYDLEARDEVAIARSLDMPILILHGSATTRSSTRTSAIGKTGLKGDAKVKVETMPSLNHLFIAGTGKPGPAEYYAPGHVDGGGNRNDRKLHRKRRRLAVVSSGGQLKASAIIVAAGSGVRLGSNVPKAFVKLGGRTMLSWSLVTVRQVSSISEVVITIPEGFEDAARAEVAAAGLACR